MKPILLILIFLFSMETQAQNNCEQQIQRMKIFEGKWKFDIKVKPTAESDEITFSSIAQNEFIYDGKFLKMEGQSKVNDITGESIGFIGFDELKCKYTYYIISSVAHDATYSEGIFDKDEGKFIFEGSNIDPFTLKKRKFRIEMKFINEGLLEQKNYFESPDGGEFLGVNIVGEKT